MDVDERIISWIQNEKEDRLEQIKRLNNDNMSVGFRAKVYSYKSLFADMPLADGYGYDDLVVRADKVCEDAAAFSPLGYTIKINPDWYDGCDSAIIHEMLHLHQIFLTDTIDKQLLANGLRKKLIVKIPYLDATFENWKETVMEDGVSLSGADDEEEKEKALKDHDYLFFLKSVDLDLRCGYELGTVFAYDIYECFDSEKFYYEMKLTDAQNH